MSKRTRILHNIYSINPITNLYIVTFRVKFKGIKCYCSKSFRRPSGKNNGIVSIMKKLELVDLKEIHIRKLSLYEHQKIYARYDFDLFVDGEWYPTQAYIMLDVANEQKLNDKFEYLKTRIIGVE